MISFPFISIFGLVLPFSCSDISTTSQMNRFANVYAAIRNTDPALEQHNNFMFSTTHMFFFRFIKVRNGCVSVSLCVYLLQRIEYASSVRLMRILSLLSFCVSFSLILCYTGRLLLSLLVHRVSAEPNATYFIQAKFPLIFISAVLPSNSIVLKCKHILWAIVLLLIVAVILIVYGRLIHSAPSFVVASDG